MSHLATPSRFIGCDVGKTAIVIHDAPRAARGRSPSIRSRSPLRRLATDLLCRARPRAAERDLLAALIAGSVRHRADARKVKAFIRSFGVLGKSDAIDAAALARYGRDRYAELPLWSAREPERLRLQALVLARRDLVKDRLAYANRRAAPAAEPVHPYLAALVEASRRKSRRSKPISTPSAPHARGSPRRQTLVTIQGVGQKTAAALIALMPELGSLPRRQAAALAGLAPHPNQSGQTDAYRRTRGGRPEIKRLLFMAASPPQNTIHPQRLLTLSRALKHLSPRFDNVLDHVLGGEGRERFAHGALHHRDLVADPVR